MYRPLNKNVLLKAQTENKGSSGLFLGNNNSTIYLVLSVGKEVLEVKENDLVYINESKKERIVIDNCEYFIVLENDIYMKVGE